MTFKKWSCKLKKWWKMTKKKCHLKNDKVWHGYHFLDHSQNLFDPMCWNMNEWKQLLLYLYLYILEGKKLLSLTLTFQKKVFFICFNDSSSKMMKNAFYFILKALFLLTIFKFLSWLFERAEKTAWLRDKVNFEIYDVTAWLRNNYNT